MTFVKYGDDYYIRIDKGEEIIGTILSLAEKEGIRSGTFSGIGGLSEAQVQTFCPEKKQFETETARGMLELISLCGSITCDNDGVLSHHTHSLVSYKENGVTKIAAGHTKSLTVLYTAEIKLTPIYDGFIGRTSDPETGMEFWRFIK